MPNSTVPTLSRSEFEQLTHRGLAGEAPAPESWTAAQQWRSEHPDWRGRHWTYEADEQGVLRLRPLNVTRATRARAAAA